MGLLASDPVEAEVRGEPAALTLRNGGEGVARRLPYFRFPMGDAELSAVGRRASLSDGAPTCSALPKQLAVVVGSTGSMHAAGQRVHCHLLPAASNNAWRRHFGFFRGI